MPKSFAEKINKAKLLVEAMRNNKETLPKPLTEEFIEDLAKRQTLQQSSTLYKKSSKPTSKRRRRVSTLSVKR